VSYDYDSYGKIISVVDSTANASSVAGENGTDDVQPYAQRPTEPEDTTKTLAELNPLRYRGYYYDTDNLGFYYLQSRYYDADTCRFISADEYTDTDTGYLGYNMFAYCNNNPTTRKDDGGKLWNFIVGAVVGALIGAVTTAVDAVKEEGLSALGSGKTWAKVGVSAACGAINGTVAASGAHLLIGGAVGSATGFIESLSHELIDNDGKMNGQSWAEVATDTAVGFLGGLAGGHGAIHGNKYMTRQTTRFAKHIATDGFKKAGKFYLKMTVNYSKRFIKPTLAGLAKGWIGGKVANYGLSVLLS
jgi:RHS repeat-associated protein